MPDMIIELNAVGKKYDLAARRRSLSGFIISYGRRQKTGREIWALREINLSVAKGETIGIIGENASGKTTLLRVISGITVPTGGTVRVRGSVAGLLDVGAGLHPELTGRENIYLDGFLYGMEKNAIDGCFERIVEFSGLKDYIDSAVKTYSQGMLVRLGLSVAVHTDPDIFLIDDSLAVGDEEFQGKCMAKISELKKKGKTIIVVSHDLDSISRICDRGVLLKAGNIIKNDSMHAVITRYVKAVGDKRSIAVVDNGKLSVIFNAGKIILLWDGKVLTKNFGGYAGLELSDKWLMSWQAQWSITGSGADYWIAEGVFNKYNAKITIECVVQNECRMLWNIRISGDRNLAGKKAGFGFMLSECYRRFYNGEALEDIPANESMPGQWMDVFRVDEQNAFLALFAADNLPVISADFDLSDHKGFCLIQLTGRELDAKVMQMQAAFPGEDSASADAEAALCCSAALELSGKSAFEIFMQKRKAERMIESGAFSLRLHRKNLQLYCRDVALTERNNLVFEFSCRGRTFNLFDGQWRLIKENNTILRVESVFKEANLSVSLMLEMCPQVLLWKMRMTGDKSAPIDALGLRAEVPEKYRNYFDEAEEKNFVSASEYNEQVYVSRGKPCFLGLSADEYSLPAMVFTTGFCAEVELCNASFDREGRVLICRATDADTASGAVTLLPTFAEKTAFVAKMKNLQTMRNLFGSGPVQLSYDSRSINMIYENTVITAEEGLCTGIYFQGRWHESRELAKEIVRHDDRLTVTIKRRIPEVTEVWDIKLDNKTMRWAVRFEGGEGIPDIHFKAGILLHPRYEEWSHAFDGGNLRQSGGDGAILELDRADYSLLAAHARDNVSSVVFESELTGTPSGIIIRRYNGQCLLQYKFKSPETPIGGEQQSFFNGVLCLFDKRSWETRLSSYRRDNFSLLAGNGFQLAVRQKKVQLMHNESELTGGDGLGITLITDHSNVEACHAEWSVKKISPRNLEISHRWTNVPLMQKWEFTCAGESIEWVIKFFVERPVQLQGLFVNVVPCVSLRQWMTQEQKGELGGNLESVSAVGLFDNRSSGIAFFDREISRICPGLLFTPQVDMRTWLVHIIKHPRTGLITCGVKYLIAPNRSVLEPGEHEIFRARLTPAQDTTDPAFLRDTVLFSGGSVLRNGKLSLSIDKAKIKLFWAKKELTKTLGLYSVFLYGNEWVDSSLARWEIKNSPDRSVVSLSWNNIPVVQQWELALRSERELSWVINTEVRHPGIKTVAASVMLSDVYREYRVDTDCPEKFPSGFKEHDWQMLGSSRNSIGIYAGDVLPGIIFNGSSGSGEYANSVENTDALHASRVVKCQSNVFKERADLFSVCFNIGIRVGGNP